MEPQQVFNRAAELHRAGRLGEAAALYDGLLAQFPDHPDTIHLRGLIDLQQGRFAEAEARMAHAVKLMPTLAAAHVNRAGALIGLGRYDEAIASAEHAIRLDPTSLGAYTNLTSALNRSNRHADALDASDRGLARGVEDALLHAHRAEAFLVLRRYEEALAACDRALSFNPDLAEAHGRRAVALTKLQRFAEATAGYQRALELTPQSPDGLCSHALAFLHAKAPLDAIAACDRALALRPDFPEALFVRARARNLLLRRDEAIADCNAALDQQPDWAAVYALRGLIHKDAKRYEHALADFDVALELDPDIELIPGESLHASLVTCEWDGFIERAGDVLAAVDAGKYVAQPFMVGMLPSTPLQQVKAARLYFQSNNPQEGRRPAPVRAFNEKIRIGYFSSDLHDHPVGQLVVGLLEAHDRSQFEIVGFSFGGDPGNVTRRRIERACDRFIDVLGMTDVQVAAMAREMNLHIAVDLNGYTAFSRPGIFAEGAAPVQVNYLGYPGTMGSERYSYIIGDRIVTPPEHHFAFSERIVTMPHTYLVTNDIKGDVPSRISGRRDLGVPETGFIFCCFNAPFKITPDAFDSWMRLLQAVEGSILWLNDPKPTGRRNLRREARERGVDPERIVFAPRTEGLEYLARYRVADLFLDTFHYNAHATASEALMVGLPVVTRLGAAFPGRVAASLLTSIGLPELIASDTPQYEQLALRLARDPAALAAVKEKLALNAGSSPLFDTKIYARNLESAYREMWDRHERGLAPDHITVR